MWDENVGRGISFLMKVGFYALCVISLLVLAGVGWGCYLLIRHFAG